MREFIPLLSLGTGGSVKTVESHRQLVVFLLLKDVVLELVFLVLQNWFVYAKRI